MHERLFIGVTLSTEVPRASGGTLTLFVPADGGVPLEIKQQAEKQLQDDTNK